MALAHTTKEAIWLRTLLAELNFKQDTTVIFEDNQSCIALAKNPVYHARTKHIDIRHHFIREKLEDREIDVHYISTDRMLADMFTKALPRPKLAQFVAELQLGVTRLN